MPTKQDIELRIVIFYFILFYFILFYLFIYLFANQILQIVTKSI